MGTNPFLKSPFIRHGGVNRRRSTRVEYRVPVILSGRDARGASFREETHTSTVNLHGARLKTSHEILVGMQVHIENPQTRAAEKGVCVRIEGDVPGEDAHYIAIQLVRPGNIWGISPPPDDWAVVAANTLGSAAASLPANVSLSGGTASAEASAPIIESQVWTWEQQSAELVDSAMQILRRQIEVLLSAALKEFESRLELLEKEAATRLELRSGKSLAEITALIQGMREEIVGQITTHGHHAVDAAERELRVKVAEILAPLVGVTTHPRTTKAEETLPRK